MRAQSLSLVELFVTPWTVAHQAPPSMGFSMQEYWNGLPFPSPGDLPNPEIEPASPELLAGDFFTFEPVGSPHENFRYKYNVPVLDFPNFSMLFIFFLTFNRELHSFVMTSVTLFYYQSLVHQSCPRTS